MWVACFSLDMLQSVKIFFQIVRPLCVESDLPTRRREVFHHTCDRLATRASGGSTRAACWRGCRSGRSGRCRSWRGSGRRRRRRAGGWKYAHEIDVLFVLAPARVEVERSRIRHITTGMIRNDGDVVAYLVLVRPAFERTKG